VDDHVGHTDVLQHAARELRHVLAARDVYAPDADVRVAHLVRDRAHLGFGARAERDARACFGQPPYGGASDAPSAAGYHGDHRYRPAIRAASIKRAFRSGRRSISPTNALVTTPD